MTKKKSKFFFLLNFLSYFFPYDRELTSPKSAYFLDVLDL